jgi:hypothetical protein
VVIWELVRGRLAGDFHTAFEVKMPMMHRGTPKAEAGSVISA